MSKTITILAALTVAAPAFAQEAPRSIPLWGRGEAELVGPTDRDVWMIDLLKGKDYALGFYGEDGVVLELVDPSGSVRKRKETAGISWRGFEYRAAVSGIHRVRIKSWGTEVFSGRFPLPYAVIFNPDCRWDAMTKCVPPVGDVPAHHAHTFNGDTDSIKLASLVAGRAYTLTVKSEWYPGAEIRNSAGTVLAKCLDGGHTCTVTFKPTASGTYFARIRETTYDWEYGAPLPYTIAFGPAS
jgi:hypothetical protein